MKNLYSLTQIPRGKTAADAKSSRRSDGLSHDGTGPHYPRRGERDMRNADRSARKEQIPDIARIQTAVRNPVASFNVHIRIGRKRRAVQTFGNMQIDIPATIGDNVLKCCMRDEILLAQNIIARKPAAFALCGEGPLF